MTWTLLHHPSSPGSRKVRVALLELGVEYQVELESYWLRRPEFSNLNVACEVPVLLPDNADPVIGDLAICEFLDEVKPDRTLLGPSLEQRSETRRLLQWFDQKFSREVTENIVGEKLTKRLMRFARQLTAESCEHDPGLRERLATLEIDLLAHEWTALRVLSSDEAGKDPGPAASILKISSTELQQSITELMMDGVGPQAVPYVDAAREPGWQGTLPGNQLSHAAAANYLDWSKVTIFGGTTEVQKNIVAKSVLGL